MFLLAGREIIPVLTEEQSFCYTDEAQWGLITASLRDIMDNVLSICSCCKGKNDYVRTVLPKFYYRIGNCSRNKFNNKG